MYRYEDVKHRLLTTDGQRLFDRVRRIALYAIRTNGAVRMDAILRDVDFGSSWDMLACMDRLVELGEIRDISPPDAIGQHRVFIQG